MSYYEDLLNKSYNDMINKLYHSITTKNNGLNVFHYTNADALMSIFDEGKLRFTRWDFLNDSSELTYIYDLINRVLFVSDYEKAFIKFVQEACSTTSSLKHSYDNGKEVDYYIASFSYTADSLLMWNNYSKNSRCEGYNLGFDAFDLKKNLENKNNITLHEGEVIYDLSKQVPIIKEILSSLYDMYRILMANEDRFYTEKIIASILDDYATIICGFMKHPSFASEEEYRLIYEYKRGAENPTKKLLVKNGLLFPYIELDFDINKCEQIIISPTLDEKLAKVGLQELKEIKNAKFNIYSSKIPYRVI